MPPYYEISSDESEEQPLSPRPRPTTGPASLTPEQRAWHLAHQPARVSNRSRPVPRSAAPSPEEVPVRRGAVAMSPAEQLVSTARAVAVQAVARSSVERDGVPRYLITLVQTVG